MLSTALTLATMSSKAQEIIQPKTPISNRSFAILVDSKTFNACQQDILEYRATLEKEGLPSYIIHHNWTKPEQVKQEIEKLYQQNKLEGIVLIGEIPIPMIRKAQHLATAFKMDESYDIKDSSIPSDRYYDDFGLKFDYIKQDSSNSLLFYYNLAIASNNKIQASIYSGRIKPISAKGTNPHAQVRSYLQKAIKAHGVENKIDNVMAYLGDGTLSNSLTAWSPELYRLEEQFPNTFIQSSQAQVFRFDSWNYPKNEIIDQLRRKDLDIVFFHEHGLTDRQYISGEFATTSLEDHLEAIQNRLKAQAVKNVKGDKTAADFFKSYQEKYFLSPQMIAGFDSPAFQEADSLRFVQQGIEVSEIDAIQPNAKFIVFDACYNGDYREADYIAGRYIFAQGETLVALGNSVSILQDVNTPHLMGILGMGISVGRWAQLNHVLESHILGDPTLRFSSNTGVDISPLFVEKSTEKLLSQYAQTDNTETKNLILHRLYELKYPQLATLLLQEFDASTFSTTRYTCLQLGLLLGRETQLQLLEKGAQDADEFIRRHSINSIAAVGDHRLLAPLVQAYLDNQHAARILFNVKMALHAFDQQDVRAVADKLFEQASFVDPNAAKELFYADQFAGYYANIDKEIFDVNSKYRAMGIRSLKNVNYHPSVPKYVAIALNTQEKESLRIGMLQTLAWFGRSYNKPAIVDMCQQLIADKNNSALLRDEAQRTLNIIK